MRSKYRELNQKLSLEADRSFSTYARMIIVRLFLLLPIEVFVLLIDRSYTIIFAVGIFALAAACSMCELIRRVDC